ncbi:3-deoxy-D-manno-octulosonic acid kinase [Neptunicella marina]|uniref:3-deoxy-D-manno-octulosonic acid kinase n=1 Tax=Neptunicella marina TaxID=2125989 RepID=A0A8J6IU57_9ALTE|nr:3-deoxy-D-manno-octulosonic acid kinase [Neptunicella marina]MBC3765900.1 3-deoxy-D-manno-octulosonic acid kinase [Neptunicella marina]
MPTIKQKTFAQQSIIYDQELMPDVSANLFDGQWLEQQQKITGKSVGRGTTYFFQHQDVHCVLRHYLRGGLIGKLIKDNYVFTGVENTRAWREFNLLVQMHQWNLPVPKPVAARIIHKGLYYRADIITRYVAKSCDLYHILKTEALSEKQWFEVGKAIAKLHQHQVYHHDLNIHNLMKDDQDVIWIIDFDKCAIKAGQQWKQQNLQRLLRSLHKEKQRLAQFHWQESDWQHLIAGYQSADLN